MEEQLNQLARIVSPNAFKVAAAQRLDLLAAKMYGFENMTQKEATVAMGTRFCLERNNIKEALSHIVDIQQALPDDAEIKIADYAQHPQGVMPEAWNIMRVEKCAKLLDLAETAAQFDQAKLAALAMEAHDVLATRAFDYFKAYSQKMAKELTRSEKTAGILDTLQQYAGKVFQSQPVKDYGGAALKGLAASAGAAPVLYYTGRQIADNSMENATEHADEILANARNKALQTALGTAGITVGASQLNHLLSKLTSPQEEKTSAEAHPFEKFAWHCLLDETLADGKVKQQNKIAAIHCLHEFIDEETPLFEKTAIPLSLLPSTALGGVFGSQAGEGPNSKIPGILGGTAGGLSGGMLGAMLTPSAAHPMLKMLARTVGGIGGGYLGGRGVRTLARPHSEEEVALRRKNFGRTAAGVIGGGTAGAATGGLGGATLGNILGRALKRTGTKLDSAMLLGAALGSGTGFGAGAASGYDLLREKPPTE